MPDHPDDASGALSRRSVLGLGIGAVAAGAGVSACSVANPVSPRRRASRPAGLSPDVTVATRALAAVEAAAAGVSATLARFPALRPELTALGTLHQAHARSLADAVPTRAPTTATPTPYAVPRRRTAAVAKLTTTETRLHASLDALALTAQSGEFARLLASMGAAVSQRLAGLTA